MTKTAEKPYPLGLQTYPYIPYKGVYPLGGVMHSNIFLFEVTNFTVLLCNPWLVNSPTYIPFTITS